MIDHLIMMLRDHRHTLTGCSLTYRNAMQVGLYGGRGEDWEVLLIGEDGGVRNYFQLAAGGLEVQPVPANSMTDRNR